MTDTYIAHPYLYLKLGEFKITGSPPQYVRDFSFQRLSSNLEHGCGLLEFSVYDDEALKFESELLKGNRQLEVSYGLTPTGATPVYKALILLWNSTFQSWGMVIKVKATLTMAANMNITGDHTFNGSPYKVINDILDVINWPKDKRDIYPMKEMYYSAVPEENAVSAEREKSFSTKGQDVLSFITQKVLPYCQAKDSDEIGYVAFFGGENNDIFICYPRGSSAYPGKTYDFFVGSGKSNVVSFSPSYQISHLRFAKGMSLSYVDANGNLQTVEVGDIENTDPSLKEKLPSAEQPRHEVVKVNSRTEAEALANYMWGFRLATVIKAQMKIVNYEHRICLFDRVIVMVYVGREFQKHYTSGQYLVNKVTESINGGELNTELDLLSLNVDISTPSPKTNEVKKTVEKKLEKPEIPDPPKRLIPKTLTAEDYAAARVLNPMILRHQEL